MDLKTTSCTYWDIDLYWFLQFLHYGKKNGYPARVCSFNLKKFAKFKTAKNAITINYFISLSLVKRKRFSTASWHHNIHYQYFCQVGCTLLACIQMWLKWEKGGNSCYLETNFCFNFDVRFIVLVVMEILV